MRRRRFVGMLSAATGGLLARTPRSLAAAPRVGVVGAGVVGAAGAARLASRGAVVLVFAKTEPAAGATGRSFAWLNAHFSKTPHHYHLLNRLGVAAWRELDHELGREALGLCWGGTLEWATAEPAAGELTAGTAQLRAWGYPVRSVAVPEESWNPGPPKDAVQRVPNASHAGPRSRMSESWHVAPRMLRLHWARRIKGMKSIRSTTPGLTSTSVPCPSALRFWWRRPNVF